MKTDYSSFMRWEYVNAYVRFYYCSKASAKRHDCGVQ